ASHPSRSAVLAPILGFSLVRVIKRRDHAWSVTESKWQHPSRRRPPALGLGLRQRRLKRAHGVMRVTCLSNHMFCLRTYKNLPRHYWGPSKARSHSSNRCTQCWQTLKFRDRPSNEKSRKMRKRRKIAKIREGEKSPIGENLGHHDIVGLEIATPIRRESR